MIIDHLDSFLLLDFPTWQLFVAHVLKITFRMPWSSGNLRRADNYKKISHYCHKDLVQAVFEITCVLMSCVLLKIDLKENKLY
jgi:hypothetical protein